MGKWAAIARVGLWLLPPLNVARQIGQYGVNVPVVDEWVIPKLLPKAVAGTATLGDFVAQFNEHRIAVPRLLIALLVPWVQGDIRAELWLAWVLAGLFSWGLYVHLGWGWRYVLAHGLVFFPSQWEIYTVGLYFKYWLPPNALVWAAAWARPWWGGILATLASFSVGSGLLVWPALLPVYASRPRFRGWAWLLAFAVCVGAYAWGYERPDRRVGVGTLLTHWPRLLHYTLAFWGGPFAAGQVAIATAVGLGLLVLAIQTGRSGCRVGWALILYGGLCGVLVAVGRFFDGPAQALTSRYGPLALSLAIGLVCAVPPLPRWQRWGLAIALVAATIPAQVNAEQTLAYLQQERLLGKACLLWHYQIPQPACTAKLNPNKVEVVIGRAPLLDALGYLQPGLRSHRKLTPEPPGDYGYIEGETGDRLWGWAVLPFKQRYADAVVVGCATGEEVTAVRIADRRQPRGDLVQALGPAYLWSGWEADLPPTVCAGSYQAFAFDTETGRVYPLQKFPPVLR